MKIFNFKMKTEDGSLALGGFNENQIVNYVYQSLNGQQSLWVALDQPKEFKDVVQVPVKGKGGKFEPDLQVQTVKTLMMIEIPEADDIDRFINWVSLSDVSGANGRLNDYYNEKNKVVTSDVMENTVDVPKEEPVVQAS